METEARPAPIKRPAWPLPAANDIGPHTRPGIQDELLQAQNTSAEPAEHLGHGDGIQSKDHNYDQVPSPNLNVQRHPGGYAPNIDGPRYRSIPSDRQQRFEHYYDQRPEAYRHPDHLHPRLERVSPYIRPSKAYLSGHTTGAEPYPSRSQPDPPNSHLTRGPRLPDEEVGYGLNTTPRQNQSEVARQEKTEARRLPWTQWMNTDVKNHFVASLGEFIGTTLFLLFAFAGTEVANIQSREDNLENSTTGFDISVQLYIALVFGFSLMVNVWVFFRISGGLFNPAVTLAMWLVDAISTARAVCIFIAQMLGSLLASIIVRGLFPEDFDVRTTLSGGASVVQGVFIEAVLTGELVFTIFMLAKEKHRATFIAPVGIGLALFIAEMVGVPFTGGSLNPARSFGPCVITLTFDSNHWIYWAGPAIGALIAVIFYKFIKTLEYEMANPGADG